MATLARVRNYPQLATYPSDDGANNRYNNCGEAVSCMVMDYCTWQKGWTPDKVHDWLYGESYLGYSYVSDLVRFLSNHGAPCAAVKVSSAEELRALATKQINAGRPLIYLSWFDLTRRVGGHFSLIRRADQRAGIVNPYGYYPQAGWTGPYMDFSWDQMWLNARRVFGSAWVIRIDCPHKSGKRLFMTRVTQRAKERMNVRRWPAIADNIVGSMPMGSTALFTQYTHDGAAWRGSTLWRYSARLGGWVHGAGTAPA